MLIDCIKLRGFQIYPVTVISWEEPKWLSQVRRVSLGQQGIQFACVEELICLLILNKSELKHDNVIMRNWAIWGSQTNHILFNPSQRRLSWLVCTVRLWKQLWLHCSHKDSFNLQFYSFCNIHGSLQVQMCTLADELVDKTHEAGTSLIQLSFRSLACMDIAMDSALHIASSCFHF